MAVENELPDVPAGNAGRGRIALGVFADFPEEAWASMDICAEMLLRHLNADRPEEVHATPLCPPFRRVASRVPGVGRGHAAFNVDRLLNRHVFYPRHAAAAARGKFDLFHVADHSYAQLIHRLPAERTGVFWHDLDAFRSIIGSPLEPRPAWFRALARRTLSGVRKAAVVFVLSSAVRREIEALQLVDPGKLVLAPPGVAEEFKPHGADAPLPHDLHQGPFVLHVGSNIPRKRIDVLLEVFAQVRGAVHGLTLLQIGGEFSPDQREQIDRLAIGPHVVQTRGVTRELIAAAYRRAQVVLVTSEAEGFGLPLAEALACAARVVASDIPVLREVGGAAATYVPVGDVNAWAATVAAMLRDPKQGPAREVRLAQAARFTWRAQAETILAAYRQRVLR